MQSIQNLMGNSNEPTNELEKLNEANTAEDVPESKGEVDSETLIKMMMTGENTEGMFNPDTEEVVDEKDKDKVHTDTSETNDVKVGKTLETSKKYREAMMKDMSKNPDKYKIETPEGEMTIEEALNRGYNPVTKKFEESVHKKNIDESMNQLNEKERARLQELTDPSQVGLAPADAESLGLPLSSPMVAQQGGQPGAMPPGAVPPGAMPPGAAPQGMPPEAMAQAGGQPGAPQPGGQPDIAALLGGMG